ncbi:hypothetical protein LCGC14_0342910 [marine sediment metagenome]|uniref:Uncharacterized protein n=1 Tax=marine sediment metagenome TaxID=412755 RepID=A0A0F9WKS5_9ZZZZ
MERIVKILVERDNMSEEDAREKFSEAKYELNLLLITGGILDTDTFCEEHFGLEPDYLNDLLMPGSGQRVQ